MNLGQLIEKLEELCNEVGDEVEVNVYNLDEVELAEVESVKIDGNRVLITTD